MSNGGVHDSESKLNQLKAVQADLTNALRQESDPNKQTDLLQKLASNRQDIAQLVGQSPTEVPPAIQGASETRAKPTQRPPTTSGVVNPRPPTQSDSQPALFSNRVDPAPSQPAFAATPPIPTPSRTQTSPANQAAAAPAQAGRVFTGRTITALAAILAAVAITWIVVAKPGSNVSNTAATGSDTTSQSASDINAEPTPLSPESDGRAAQFQTELNRLVATNPIIFSANETALSDIHRRTLDKVAVSMSNFPDLPVKVQGFTDTKGDGGANQQLSLQRAENVKNYLIEKGISGNLLTVEALGEASSSEAGNLESLERKVEFEVQATMNNPTAMRIAIIAPSAENDLAFTQSIVDAAQIVSSERGDVELSIEQNLFVPAEAGAAIRNYASQDFDLIIAHGSQYGPELQPIAAEYPDVTFAWGTAGDTFGLANVYAYEAAAEEGGYVLGSMSALLSANKSIGVIGPIEVGDAKRFVNGFQKGAQDEVPDVSVDVEYINSFTDTELAAEVATRRITEGVDVLTGTGQMIAGAIPVVEQNGALWLGTQSSQASLAPNNVVASQVYHWEVILRQIVDEVSTGTTSGRAFTANLANGGLIIELNTSYALSPEVRDRGNQIIEDVKSGAVDLLPAS